jgi:putative transposase
MKMVRWRTLYPKKGTTCSEKQAHKYPYLLKDLHIERSNQVWAIDITYIPMKRGFMYLFAIIDVYSRYVVDWSVSNTMTAEWCVNTLAEAVAEHPPEGWRGRANTYFITSAIYVPVSEDCF